MFIVVNEGSTANTTKRTFFLSKTKRTYMCTLHCMGL